MATNMFGSAVPANSGYAIAYPVAFVAKFQSSTPGDITGLRWYIINTGMGDGRVTEAYVRLWDSSGGEGDSNRILAEKEIHASLIGASVGWKEFLFDDPVTITENHTYGIAIDFATFTGSVLSGFTAAYGTPLTIDNFDLEMLGVREDVGHQNYPGGSGNDTNYFVDVISAAPATATVDVGADVAVFIIDPIVDCVAVAEGTGTLTYAWTKTSGPFGSFADATAATTTFSPDGGDGTYVLRCSVTDDFGTGYDEFTVIVTDPDRHSLPVAVASDTGWTYVGGTDVDTLGDEDGGTFALSLANPDGLQLVLDMDALDPTGDGVDLKLLLDIDWYGTGVGASVTAFLYEGEVLRSTAAPVSIAEGAIDQDVAHSVELLFPAADMADITDWASLQLWVEVTAE